MDFSPKINTLTNKMKIIQVDLPLAKSATAMVVIKVGSRYEDDKIAGISHFLEHMVFKGTKKYPTALAISQTIDSIGAECNAFTSKEYTGFYVKASSEHLDLALDVLNQMVFSPLLDAREMEKEKGVIIEEINMREDIPMAKVSENFESLLYGKTHLGRDIIGFKNTIKNLKKNDFVDYLNNWYCPEKMVLGIVGGISSSKAHFPHIKVSPCGDCGTKNLEKLEFGQTKVNLHIQNKKTEQAHLCLGVRTFPRNHKDKYVMAVLATILGGNMSSRLFTEVREKRGLAYYIKSDINTYFDNGYLVSQAGTDLNKAEETVKVILNEFRKIYDVRYKIYDKELKRAKEYLKGRLALSLEDSKEIASLFIEDLLLDGKIRQIQEIISGIEKVSLDDLLRVAKQIFVNQGLNLAVIGPFEDKSRFEKLLKI